MSVRNNHMLLQNISVASNSYVSLRISMFSASSSMILLWIILLQGSHGFLRTTTTTTTTRTIVNHHYYHRQLLAPTAIAAASKSWHDLMDSEPLKGCLSQAPPVCIDSALEKEPHVFSNERPTLFRERHGWCPYSERVWLALEVLKVDYDTILIDNTGGPRPSYFAGSTPQIRWPNQDRRQGESLDLVQALDERYYGGDNSRLLQTDQGIVQDCIGKFRSIFPQRTRPSSRAAFLFQGNGEPLWRTTFENTLQGTNDLLAISDGPFLCGKDLTAADIAWAPFLERYRYQLPCLHKGLNPNDATTYPNLSRWYQAMDEQIPAYACRVRGDASSWRKVLTMAGFGNSGIPSNIEENIQEQMSYLEIDEARSILQNNHLWKDYCKSEGDTCRVCASSPQAQVALIITRNRAAIAKDILKRTSSSSSSSSSSSWKEDELDISMRNLVTVLLTISTKDLCGADDSLMATTVNDDENVYKLASYLDERMCVPRDMGAMSAACIKLIASMHKK